jgi:hypothetical protein
MLTIKEYIDGMMVYACGYSEKHFNCPHCSAPQVHVTEELPFCVNCYEELLDVEALLEKPEYRIGYHFNHIGDGG